MSQSPQDEAEVALTENAVGCPEACAQQGTVVEEHGSALADVGTCLVVDESGVTDAGVVSAQVMGTPDVEGSIHAIKLAIFDQDTPRFFSVEARGILVVALELRTEGFDPGALIEDDHAIRSVLYAAVVEIQPFGRGHLEAHIAGKADGAGVGGVSEEAEGIGLGAEREAVVVPEIKVAAPLEGEVAVDEEGAFDADVGVGGFEMDDGTRVQDELGAFLDPQQALVAGDVQGTA